MVLLNSHRVSRVPQYLGVRSRKSDPFRLRGYHPLWHAVPGISAINQIGNFPTNPEIRQIGSHDPEYATLPGLTHTRFGLFPVRSPLLRESLLLSLPEVTKMFQFTSLASAAYVFSYRCPDTTRDGFPHSEISGSKLVQQLPEAYRSWPRLSSPLDAKASTVCPY